MLVMTRSVGDNTIINDNLAMRVVAIKGYVAKIDLYEYSFVKGAKKPVVKWLRRIEAGMNEMFNVLPNVRVHFQKTSSRSIRMCHDAPRDIPIHREEVYHRIVNEVD